ncbi:MAG: hypothetical protein FP826_03450 [Sphingomonadales bacterium]|nr:hypothetical protein [Sphingomonadales bacterium]MBU3993931.1 hypothetical protein [Alphaproteobacteria bacterium]
MTLDWGALAGGLADVEAELRAAAPDPLAAEEAGPYVARLLVSALHDGFLAYEDMGSGLKRAWPRLGGPFLDYRMWLASLEPGRGYRLTGSLNDVERLGVGTYSVTPEGVLLLEDYTVFRTGDFSLDIGPDGQLKTTGNTRLLMVRELLRPPGRRPADMHLTFADGTALPLPAGNRNLAMAGGWVAAMARQFARWSARMAETPNAFTTPPPELAAAYLGDLGTHYYPGYYDLGEDEVLVIERPAVACATWSVSAYTHWLEPLPPPYAALGRIDDRGAGTGPDRAVTIRLAPDAAGLAGPAIATGRRRGALLYRTIDAQDLAIPQTRIERR